MSIYAIGNNSGSVGKTTTAVTVGVLLAQRGVRVRVVDLDPQANASTWLGWPGEATSPSVAEVLRARATIAEVEKPARVAVDIDDYGRPVYDGAVIENLTVVPAVRSTLDSLVVELAAQTGAVMNLQDALRVAPAVDVTLIDCPGSLNVLAVAAFLATVAEDNGGVITCVKPSGKETEGIPALQSELAGLERLYKDHVPLLAIVPCAVPGQGDIYVEQLAGLVEAFGERVTPPTRRRAVVDEAYTNYVPVPLMVPRTKQSREITADYDGVVDHLLGLGLLGGRVSAVGVRA